MILCHLPYFYREKHGLRVPWNLSWARQAMPQKEVENGKDVAYTDHGFQN